MLLAHYYQDGEIQDLADFVGDSLDCRAKPPRLMRYTIDYPYRPRASRAVP